MKKKLLNISKIKTMLITLSSVIIFLTAANQAISSTRENASGNQIADQKSNNPSYKPRYDTIAHKILKLEADSAPVSDEMYRLLDILLDEAKAKIRLKPIPGDRDLRKIYAQEILSAIDDILIRHNFIYPRNRKSDWTLLLSDGLTPQKLDANTLNELMLQRHNTRRRERINPENPFYLVDCDTASYLYLAVGEILRLPLSMVDLPEHIFIRWSFDSYSYLNWETMYGTLRGNDEYRGLFFSDDDLAEELFNRRVYLVAMSQQDVIGYVYGARALQWEKKKDYKRAIEDYLESIRLYPRIPFSYNNLAWIYATCPEARYRSGQKAIEFAHKAINIHPKHANYLDTLAAGYAENKEFDKAVVTEQQAYRLEPSEGYRELIEVYKQGKTYAQYQQEKSSADK